MNRFRFRPFVWMFLFLEAMLVQTPQGAELQLSNLVVNTGERFSLYINVRNAVGLKSYTIRLHIPFESISRIESIAAPATGSSSYSSFEVTSLYDEDLQSVVWSIKAAFSQPFSGDTMLFTVQAVAADQASFNTIGVAIQSGELLGAYLHGGSIYVLNPDWPWYDLQINYRNAFQRLDLDNSGRIDRRDLLLFTSAWHQSFSTDTTGENQPTPTPAQNPIPSIEEFLGRWRFDFLHNTLFGLDIHVVFDAVLEENGAMILQDKYQSKYLGTFTYDSTTGIIDGVFMITDSNPLNPTENSDYFVEFQGTAGVGNSLKGSAKFIYNNSDLQIEGYESYGLTLADTANFIAVKQ